MLSAGFDLHSMHVRLKRVRDHRVIERHVEGIPQPLCMPRITDGLKRFYGTMPKVVLSDDEASAAYESAGSDLKFLLEKQGVTRENQVIFYHIGVVSIEKFGNIAKDRDDLVAMLKEHWGIDQDNSLPERVQVAAVVCAYTNAKTRVQRSAEVDAEYDVQEWTKPVVAGEWAAMRAALEKRQGTLDDKVAPAKEYVEKKLAEVEAGEYRAEELSEVVSRDEVEPDAIHPVWDSKGRLTMRRSSTKVSEPTNAEELRRRLTVLRNCMVMLSLKHTNRHELQGEWNSVVEEYKEYLLGDYVYGLSAKDSEGNTIASPPWNLVISYEKAIRKQATKLVNNEGKPWPVALKAAWKDATVKERYFTTPLALYSKRPAPPWRDSAQQQQTWRRTEQNKGKSKGKSKGKQKGHCATHTPEGDMVCFRYDTVGEKCREKKCKYKHVCGICFSSKHPMHECSARNRQEPPKGDTQGTS